ncbi:hypothetical protein RhiXN_07263 [Rhizoctonia solani]|uniref:Uncharacterized protein n=1 Tax=Rhizoctonia solani TaxID=456999 RepID=A0A8H8T1F8_9AGAM|nr:uncharacterized protein RhiXN_07263 [Rhizoctonia solani]QRW25314.1 hypothetical protein RhiXN_07263 [Rhizoctonia solani]
MAGNSPPVYKSRAPAINPFDKLNQNQFDSYVSSIQAKIKVALDPPSPEPQHVSRTFAEISRSTIASPAPLATYTPLGAGTPNEPYELSDNDSDDELIQEAQSPRLRSHSEAPYEEEEAEPLGSIQEASEDDGDETEGEQQSTNADLYGQEPNEGAWDYSGEDASEQDEFSEAEDVEENEEEDVFVGKGKGRHPAEGPGLAGLLSSSSAHHASVAPGSPERMSDSISPDNSFEAGVARMPILGTTSTPFVSKFATRRSARNMEYIDDNEDDGSPPWEDIGDEEAAFGELGATGTDHDTAIEPPLARLSGARIPDGLYDDLGVAYPGLDEPQFNDSAAFPHRTFEPDSLLDDTMDDHGLAMPGNVLPKQSSLFTGSSTDRTREPSESRDVEESADTAHASFDSTKHGLFDFIGEKSLLANQLDNSLTRTQVEENFLEVTVYELENGSRFYDHDGMRHFLNPEGEVYETCPIPPSRPTIQRPPDLSMIEEVTEYDMTRRMIGHDTYDDGHAPDRFDFLKGLDDTMSSVGGPISHYHRDDNASGTFDMEDIPQRPGAAMGFRARIVRGADGSAFLSESLVLEDSINESLPTERANPLRDLISEADDLINDEDEGSSRDRSGMSALANREDLTTPVPHRQAQFIEDQPTKEGMDISIAQDLPVLDEKSVADALAAVAQFAQASSFGNMDIVSEVPETDVSMLANSEYGALSQDADGLENLMNTTTSMTSAEEDILARSFGLVDALQNTAGPAAKSRNDGAEQCPGRKNPGPAYRLDTNGDRETCLEVLAEVFEGVNSLVVPSGTATSTATPSEAPFSEIGNTTMEIQEVSPHRTPTPTLSTGQSLTAPEMSIATSISGPQLNISIYDGSPARLQIKTWPMPFLQKTHRELSPSVVVEPPTPHTRSEDDAEHVVQDSKLKNDTKAAETEIDDLAPVNPGQTSDPEDTASVDELLSDGENTETDRSHRVGDSSGETFGQSEAKQHPHPISSA